MRLATLLATLTNEAEIRKILGLFPALVDGRMVTELKPVVKYAEEYAEGIDEGPVNRLRNLLAMVREIVEGKRG